jgi:nitrite reductase (cytochrome c-552)
VKISDRIAKMLPAALFTIVVVATAAVLALLFDIREKKREAKHYPFKVVEIPAGETNPVLWGKNFPFEYDSYKKTETDYGSTRYGGSTPYSRLERTPALRKLYAGYAFSVDYNEERGHHYAAIDQKRTKRVKVVKQPGACLNCHTAQAPAMMQSLGWEAFNRGPFDSLSAMARSGIACSDCHDPETMDLVITRPAFRNAMAEAGVNLDTATRQEMRSYVCGQCHVEYYFKGEDKILTFPWSRGRNIDSIEAHYAAYGFKDWAHKESGAPMIKIQHPEFEMWGTSLHAQAGVSCADCHMPYVRQGSVKVSDHWVRSPLKQLNACKQCHPITDRELEERVLLIQDRTAELLKRAESALCDAIDAIAAAKAAGASDAALEKARSLHRSSQLRWDFVSSENSTGFHSPQEAARILAESMDMARQAQLEAVKIR